MPEDPVACWADRDRISEVVENLLSNAAKYSPDGGSIGVTVRVEDENAIVRVSDQGIGIDQADLHRLFRPFSRVKTARTAKIEGSGLGLYICDRIVNAHAGRLWVESEPDRGSVFSFALPIFGVAAQTREPLVLVAAGDAGTRREIARVAEELGYRVHEVADGVDAVESSLRLRPMAIVLDRILPGLAAEEVAERLRLTSATAAIPVFVLARPEDLGEDAKLFQAFVPKPLDRLALASALEAVPTTTP
jgi:CheY-like chemotaxis protein